MGDLRDVEITKGPNGYGFNLSKSGTMHFLRVVDLDGPASKAGAKAGDRIMKVNGQDVTKVTHSQLVTLIKVCGQVLKMTLRQLTTEELESMKSDSNPPNAQPSMPASSHSQQKPVNPVPNALGLVSLVIIKGPKGFGFNLARVQDKHIFRVVDPGGAAHKAGAHPGDILMKVNGEDVSTAEHKRVVELIKASGPQVVIEVVPNTGADVGELPPDMTAWTDVKNKAEKVILENQQRIKQAKAQMEVEWQRKKEAQEERAKALLDARRRQTFDQSKQDLEKRLEEAGEALAKAQTEMQEAMEHASTKANKVEMNDMKVMLEDIEKSTRKELEERHSEPLPDEEFEAELAALQRELEVMSLEEEICQVHKVEWNKLYYEARDRREAEQKEEDQVYEKTKALRERDMEFLKQKQARIDRMLAEAEEKKAKELEERKQREAQKKAEKEAQIKSRIESVQAASARREEEERMQKERDEAIRRREEEARMIREQEEREEAKRRESKPDESGFTLKRPQLRSVNDGNKQHPMIAAMSQQKTLQGKLPFKIGQDTKM